MVASTAQSVCHADVLRDRSKFKVHSFGKPYLLVRSNSKLVHSNMIGYHIFKSYIKISTVKKMIRMLDASAYHPPSRSLIIMYKIIIIELLIYSNI